VSRGRFALIGLCAVLAPLGLDARGEVPAAYPDPPEILFKDLFVAVQTSAIYADGKTFVDAVPNAAPRRILADYCAANPQSPQALEHFTDEHCSLPSAAGPLPAASKATQPTPHIDGLWDQLLVEKYDVINTQRAGGGGEYPLQDGFGWTNGVTR
jgi:alpha,alpha-trehalase